MTTIDLPRLAAANLVATIDYHDRLGSTNDRALELSARGEADLPLLVVAEQQTAGRGRGANRWLSSQGALTFSLALSAPPDRLPPDRWPLVALSAGLATCEALLEHAPTADLRLKWPNDILLRGRKVCGILSESVPGWRDRLIVGIGVNVNNRLEGVLPTDASATAARLATSLIEHDGLARDLTGVLVSILDHLERRWQQLVAGHDETLLTAFQGRCFLSGRTVTLQQASGERMVGICQGIDRLGRLALQTEQGPMAAVSGTVISWED